jgi:hypothetical protein
MTNKQVVTSLGNAVCPKHPRWQKKRKPTSTCQNCWFIWIMRLLANDATELRFD